MPSSDNAITQFVSRIGSLAIALALLAGVVYLGILSSRDSEYVAWFGIAAAIAAPVGLSLFAYALTQSDRDIVQRLAKVPEIEKLVAEAKTQEDKVRVLESEQARLVEIIRVESRRQAARDRIESLERDAVRVLQELDSLSEELRLLDEGAVESIAHKEIEHLRERVRARSRGDVVLRLGTRTYHVDRDIIKALPFGLGNVTLAYLRVLELVQRRIGRAPKSKTRSA